MNKEATNTHTPPRKNGPIITYRTNGEVDSTTYYANDKKHGADTLWDKNGQKRVERMWAKDKLHGQERWWREDGSKMRDVYYILWKEYTRIEWDEEGNVTEVKLPILSPASAKPKSKKSDKITSLKNNNK